MLDAIEKIVSYTDESDLRAFEQNSMMHDACLMQFQHIGEIANKTQEKFPEIELPYRDII